jgi:mRNA-degrading endonuclease RelE of RelBE toxin-antitoxin system
MAYTILISSKAEKFLKKQTENTVSQLKTKILSLSNNPKPRLSKTLSGINSGIRILHNNCKILYSINEEAQEVTIYKINKRRKAYSTL